jgi:hypothetical protein
LFNLTDQDNFTYTGFCQQDRINIEMEFLDDWRLEFFFNKDESTFLFKHVILYYKLQGPLFPNSLDEGGQSEIYDYPFVNSSLNKTYKCNSGIHIELGDVTLYMKNVIIEPFFDTRRIPHAFDLENVCFGDLEKPADNSIENIILICLIAGLIVIVLGSCIGFMCMKIRSRSNEGYQRAESTSSEKKAFSRRKSSKFLRQGATSDEPE